MSTNKRLPKGLSVINHNETLLAKLYATLIVEYNTTENRLILRTGGWRTMHTKKCINLVLAPYGIKVVQRKGEWFIMRNGTEIGLFHNDTWTSGLAA